MILNGLIRAVIIVLTFLHLVDSLVFRTPSNAYSETHANRLYEIHEGEYWLCPQISKVDLISIL